MDFRTDLAVEQREMTAKHSDNVAVRQYARQNANVTEIEILNDEGAQELGKPKGKYITMEIPAFSHDSELLDGRLTAMTESIRTLLPDEDGPVLVAGLGNEDVTPDALGPRTAHGIFATRHIDRALASALGFGELRDVCAITFGVLGQTGMETAETIRGIVNTIHPRRRHYGGRTRGAFLTTSRQNRAAHRHRHYAGVGCRQQPRKARQRNARRAGDCDRCADGGGRGYAGSGFHKRAQNGKGKGRRG